MVGFIYMRQTKSLLFNFWMIKYTTFPKNTIRHWAIWQNWCFGSILSFKNWKVNTYLYVKNISSRKFHNCVKKIWLSIVSFKNWKVNTLPSKNMQTETTKFVLVFWGNERKYFSHILGHSLSHFFLVGVWFLREREKIFCTYSGP